MFHFIEAGDFAAETRCCGMVYLICQFWNREAQIASYGEVIDDWRKTFLDCVRPRFESLCYRLGLGFPLSLFYKNGWGQDRCTGIKEIGREKQRQGRR